jgi:hypothetical protein
MNYNLCRLWKTRISKKKPAIGKEAGFFVIQLWKNMGYSDA